jgi:hypothetical protein
MKRLIRSPFSGLVLTGVTASAALLVETRLSLAQDVHFLLQLVWLGVVCAALLAFAIHPALSPSLQAPDQREASYADIPEWLDEDRAWLQMHSNANGSEDFEQGETS